MQRTKVDQTLRRQFFGLKLALEFQDAVVAILVIIFAGNYDFHLIIVRE